MAALVMPPGARAKTHLHRGIETAAYVIDGRAEMFYGRRLEEHMEAGVAHTAASDQEGIVLLPELDALIP